MPSDTPIERRYLSTREAAAYCGFKTTSALRKAHLAGRIFPADFVDDQCGQRQRQFVGAFKERHLGLDTGPPVVVADF